jgi:adenylate kinase
MGPPGSGKGTQGQQLAKAFGWARFSTGETLRKEVALGTPLGREAEGWMMRGALVPDSLLHELVIQACTKGQSLLLDGYPRNLAQAQSLWEHGPFQAWHLDVSETVLLKRLSGRWVCSHCSQPYHEALPPAKVGICDLCGHSLLQRPDDREEIVAQRIAQDRELMAPVYRFFQDRGAYRRIPGDLSREAVFQELAKILVEVQKGTEGE